MRMVAMTWIAPRTMKTPARMAMAWVVTRSDDTSQTPNANRLMPAEQCALIRCEICGTYAAPARAAPMKPATSVARSIDAPPEPKTASPAVSHLRAWRLGGRGLDWSNGAEAPTVFVCREG